MGVQGLLPVLKTIQEPTTLERYRGKTLAIDTYAWLHKASFTCAEDLVLERPTKAYINYFKKKIDMLRHFNITPYFVFDGDYLPSKAGTEKEREIRRDEYKKLATEAKQNDNPKLAYSYYQKACDISPEMAKSLINELKLKFIKYVVAPYEADSQMVFLEKLGLVDGIISEDSDLLIFGCQTLITKLDDKAQCIEIKRENFKNVKGSYINAFNDDQLLLMAAISGCDYTKGIPGIGMQKAIQMVKFYKTFDRIVMSIKVEGKSIPSGFEEEYKRARIAFRHQIVFNPIEGLAQHLNPLTEDVTSTYSKEYIHSCTGFILDQEIHKKIAYGDLDPFSKNVLISWEIKVNPTEAFRSSSQPIISNAFATSKTIKRSATSLPIVNRSAEKDPVVRKRKPTAMRIDHFSNFVKSKKRINIEKKAEAKVNLSPTAKRQKILDFNQNVPGTISSFFSHKKEVTEEIVKEKDFPATSSDTDEITEEDINDLNLKLNKSIEESQNNINTNDNTKSTENDTKIERRFDDALSSDIVISESDDDSQRSTMDNKNILKSDSDMEDIIDSSQMSESTLTMDKSASHQTPMSLMMAESSLSSGISTDAGDVNTECYIEEDGSSVNGSRFDESLEDETLDKSNLLAEIYSFNHAKVKSSVPTGLISNNHSKPNSVSKTAFSPERFVRKLDSSKVRRPSPLHNRVPLMDVTNVSTANTANKGKIQSESSRSSPRSSLSVFRYTGN